MDDPVFTHDAAGFWYWRTKDFFSDRTFASQEEAETNYQRLLEVYENSEEIK